ncbi:MAG: M20/M25/M40 family metallo-hydrolase [Lachnospiraceae bacterium]|nr:M20/M25/M40 family metallo-hydrolase [Lachnospiraceae bacterium]
MLELTRKMVRIPSINTTAGEAAIGEFLEGYFRELPYFQQHPEYLITQELHEDRLHRRNVIALLRGEKDDNPKTVILHGHTDTVGLEGYGALEDVACNPDRLMEAMKFMELPDAVRADLESGAYLFGRGSCDMKSGDAVFMVLIKRLSEHPEELSGNLIISLNPVEENLHTGIIEALPVLAKLQEQYGLQYVLAMNNDFTSPLFEGDEAKTIYTGIGGKVLPCFYIHGKETHVGQCFEGFDASMFAAELVHRIHLSGKFSDTYNGETTNPPSVLKIKDLKTWYNVQTAKEALVYFNYFVHNASMEEITKGLLDEAKEVFDDILTKIHTEFQNYCNVNHQNYSEYNYEKRVLTYDALYGMASKEAGFSAEKIRDIVTGEQMRGIDRREIPIEIIRYLLKLLKFTGPTVVLYYAAPFCPHSTVKSDQQQLLDLLTKVIGEIGAETDTTFRLMSFYPSLSDSSYLRIDDSEASMDMLLRNFPEVELLYPVPIEAIRKVNVPAINVGCYGKDAHKWTERVNIPYTFGVLPELELRLIHGVLETK